MGKPYYRLEFTGKGYWSLGVVLGFVMGWEKVQTELWDLATLVEGAFNWNDTKYTIDGVGTINTGLSHIQ